MARTAVRTSEQRHAVSQNAPAVAVSMITGNIITIACSGDETSGTPTFTTTIITSFAEVQRRLWVRAV